MLPTDLQNYSACIAKFCNFVRFPQIKYNIINNLIKQQRVRICGENAVNMRPKRIAFTVLYEEQARGIPHHDSSMTGLAKKHAKLAEDFLGTRPSELRARLWVFELLAE
jgi:hypothetical protein